MNAQEMANFLEANQDFLVELLVETEGQYESQQMRLEALIRKLRKAEDAK